MMELGIMQGQSATVEDDAVWDSGVAADDGLSFARMVSSVVASCTDTRYRTRIPA